MGDVFRVGVTLLGPERDGSWKDGGPESRWAKFRPSVAFSLQQDLPLDRVVLVYQPDGAELASQIEADILEERRRHPELRHRPEVEARTHRIDNFYDLDGCFNNLRELFLSLLSASVPQHKRVHLYANINTGSHCTLLAMYLLAFGKVLPDPFDLVQVAPGSTGSGAAGKRSGNGVKAQAATLDMTFTRYAAFRDERQRQREETLKELAEMEVGSPAFQRDFEELMMVGAETDDPIVLQGASGVGKSRIAERIHQSWRRRKEAQGFQAGSLVQQNCAGLPETLADSLLFGHVKGAFTGAHRDQEGLLEKANGGTLFLDEVADLPLPVQGKLLLAIEYKQFHPLGSFDTRKKSDFRLIAATNKRLSEEVRAGRFREDLYARIRCWEYELPGLIQLRDQFPRYVEKQLEEWMREEFEARRPSHVTFDQRARERYLRFAASERAAWSGNFRDLQQSVRRMATRAWRGANGVITEEIVEREVQELQRRWAPPETTQDVDTVIDSLVELVSRRNDNLCLVDRVHDLLLDWARRKERSNAAAGRCLYGRPSGPDNRNFAAKFADNRRQLEKSARQGLANDPAGESRPTTEPLKA